MSTLKRPLVALASIAALASFATACGSSKSSSTTAAPTTAAGPTTTLAHWTYEGEEGPANWGKLDPAYAKCADGTAQTPIDIVDAKPADLPDPKLSWSAGDVKVVNNGHTIVVNAAKGSTTSVGDATFPLVQMHFHAPSEHTVAGKSFPLEVHFVHITPEKKIAVIGVMITEGTKDNEDWAPYVAALGATKGNDITTKIDWTKLLPADHTTFRYAGSLTTPPCTEGVSWMLMSNPVELSATQIAAFVKAYGDNSRPVQPLNGRTIELDNTPGK